MRLLTHNILRSNVEGADEGYPLSIEASEVVVEESTFRADFIRHVAGTLNWDALRKACQQVGMEEGCLPEKLTDDLLGSEDFLQALHKVLMDVHVIEGTLVCPDTGRQFPIKQGVPDMIIGEKECSRQR